MSLDNEDRRLPDSCSSILSEKHSKISYTREFLLSLSELDICKKLPSGFDRSILSEFEGTSHAIPDRQRIPGGLPLQGFRRNDYGSSPPTRGIYGRWENRFSVRSDQESDAHSAQDSESGRRHGNQPRQSWQSPEHDGLLGSGSFPRPSGCASGIPAPKAWGNDHYQLNKSNEPYHPPRPYKAGPQSRRDASDSYNNETFGSVECASEDRVEEERRRRVSFELMRKEQQKAALQKKQILNLDKLETECVPDSDMSALAEDVKEESKLLDRRKELDASTTLPDADNDSGRSFPSQNSASRPLIPPGFRSTLLEKDSGVKSLIHPPLKQATKPETEESLLHSGMDPVQNGFFDGLERQSSQSSQELLPSVQQLDDKSIHVPIMKKGNQIDFSNKKPCMDDNLHHPSSVLETQKLMEDPEIIELTAELSQEKIEGESDPNQSTSILDKIFGSAISMTVGESEHQDTKPDDKWSSRNIQSSKFAQWFFEEAETKPKDDSSSIPNDLLTLIASGDNSRSQVCDVKSTENILSNALAATLEVSEPLYVSSKDDAVPAVLTCEDLEQTILSEYSENSSNLQSLLPGWSTDPKPKEQKDHVDDCASQHLLSLLQKGPDLRTKIPKSNMVTVSMDEHDKFAEDNKSMEDESHTLGKAITLETLFGTAFMKELQSMQAPVSVQRGSAASGQTDGLESQVSSLLVPNGEFFPSTIDDLGGSERMSNDNNVLVDREQTKLDKVEKWLGFDDSLTELNSMHRTDRLYKNGDFDGVVGFQLPEDESLFSGGNPVNPQVSVYMADGNLNKGEFLLPSAPMGVAEQLASVHSAPSNQRNMVGPGGLPFLHGHCDQVEPDMFRSPPAQPSSSLFHPMQMSQGRPLIHPFETLPAHSNSQMKFAGPEIMTHIDAPTSHQFSVNMMRPPFHRSNPAVSGFDLATQHPMLQQQIQMPGNYPRMLHDRLRSAPVPPHPGNQPAAFLQEPNPMEVIPFGPRPPRQPNINGFGIPMAADINRGSNQPEAIQRLFEMEVGASSKQMHPFAAGNSQGMYGHELDMGQRYR